MADLSITRDGALKGDMKEMDRLRKAANQFEAYFLKEILKPSEESEGFGGVMDDGAGMRQFKEMLHEGFAERGAGRLGIADMLIKDLSDRMGALGPESEK